MSTFRIKEAADLLGVSDDTLRRWITAGRVPVTTSGGRQAIDGVELISFAEQLAATAERPTTGPILGESARNRFVGLVINVVKDKVMAQVEIQAGPHRIVSLLSREAADELGLERGALAIASVKATNVVVEIPDRAPVRQGSS